mgnify:CR=1 FL=1
MWLVKNGVPYDVAFSLDDVYRCGMAIIFSEFESGRVFNFRTMRFDELQTK